MCIQYIYTYIYICISISYSNKLSPLCREILAEVENNDAHTVWQICFYSASVYTKTNQQIKQHPIPSLRPKTNEFRMWIKTPKL